CAISRTIWQPNFNYW
nr:immunoglobulin heavy chain junction region [Macaca mulatta]